MADTLCLILVAVLLVSCSGEPTGHGHENTQLQPQVPANQTNGTGRATAYLVNSHGATGVDPQGRPTQPPTHLGAVTGGEIIAKRAALKPSPPAKEPASSSSAEGGPPPVEAKPVAIPKPLAGSTAQKEEEDKETRETMALYREQADAVAARSGTVPNEETELDAEGKPKPKAKAKSMYPSSIDTQDPQMVNHQMDNPEAVGKANAANAGEEEEEGEGEGEGEGGNGEGTEGTAHEASPLPTEESPLENPSLTQTAHPNSPETLAQLGAKPKHNWKQVLSDGFLGVKEPKEFSGMDEYPEMLVPEF